MIPKSLIIASKSYPAVPITLSFYMPTFNEITIFNNLHTVGTPGFLLTGKPKDKEIGFTFIGINPQRTYNYRDGSLIINDQKEYKTCSPLKVTLEDVLKKYQTPKFSNLPPFTGGLVGYFGYDYARYATKAIIKKSDNPLKLDDADLLLITTSIAFNHTTKMVTISEIVPSVDLIEKYDSIIENLKQLKNTILIKKATSLPKFRLTSPFKFQFSLSEFTQQVLLAQKYIIDGDIFQVILSNPQMATFKGSLLGLAPTLFTQNQTPYQFYFTHDNFEAVGASPETLITKRDSTLFTYPLAGTRRRGKNALEDNFFAKELQHDPKEQAEHNMLIDLGRNDLGQVSQFGSVKVTKTRKLLKFANVMHLGSTIESQVADNKTPLDIIEAVLPAGTLSGAPKISAMQIISNLEHRKRGIYGGCLGYIDLNGDLDFCIGIRLAYRKEKHLVVHSGAGIVADSIPNYEFKEFINKSRNIINAINQVDQGDQEDVVLNR